MTSYGKFNLVNGALVFDSFDPTTFANGGKNFIDGNGENTSIEDYNNYGPNNELYLDGGQGIVLKIDETYMSNTAGIDGIAGVADIQMGFKSADGGAISVEIYNYVKNSEGNYALANSITLDVTTASDQFYSILECYSGILVIKNADDSAGMLSITSIKTTIVPDSSTNTAEPLPNSGETLSNVPATDDSIKVFTALAKFYIDVVIAVAGTFEGIENVLKLFYTLVTAVI